MRQPSTPTTRGGHRQRAAAGDLAGEYGIRPTTGGTDTHLSLHDLQGIGVTGVEAEARADAAGIVLNKNAIPFDPEKPNIASGIRVGTPCTTTQGWAPRR